MYEQCEEQERLLYALKIATEKLVSAEAVARRESGCNARAKEKEAQDARCARQEASKALFEHWGKHGRGHVNVGALARR